MVVKVADYILSPLGDGTDINYQAIKSGKTSLKRYEHKWGLEEPFVASIFDEDVLECLSSEMNIDKSVYTRFECLAIIAAAKALRKLDINVSSSDVLFIISSTKGNVHLLSQRDKSTSDYGLSMAVNKIVKWFRNPRTPLVVCNACISGLHAQIEAMRFLHANIAKTIVVIAVDMLSPFIVSGFQAFKSLSDEFCRPFDEERLGLNLGEAAACIVYQLKDKESLNSSDWIAMRGAVYNDAFHISHPSKTAEGSWRALLDALKGTAPNTLTMVNVHGTATMFNDEMESVALARAGLINTPINSLKGYLGHTLGAAGLLETILTMASLDDGIILGTKGFTTLGVSNLVNISAKNRTTNGKKFIKLISGFGGCNAAMRFETVEG